MATGLARLGLLRVTPTAADGSNGASGSQNENTKIDIIAIHGLGTESPRTWEFKHKDDGRIVNWLSDTSMLPSSAREATIYVYNWNARYFENAPVQTLLGHADTLLGLLADRAYSGRPLIFIASCFGGLVLAEAMNRAGQEGSPYRDILRLTAGIIFLATPFKGSDAYREAQWQVVVGGIMGPLTSSSLVEALNNSDRELRTLTQSFAELARRQTVNLPIYCFYETRKTEMLRRLLSPGLATRFSAAFRHTTFKLLVAESSACLDTFDRHGLDATHSGMNKFSGPEDLNYILVRGALSRLMGNVPAVLARWGSSRPQEQTLPEFHPVGNAISNLSHSHEKSLDKNKGMVDAARRRELNEWLDPTPTSETFDLIRSHRLDGSCRWIYENKFFHRWLTEARWRVCHMDGPPGYGKSTMVTKLIEDLQAKHPVAFFFCRVGEERQSWGDIIRTWIWQFLGQKPEPDLIDGVYDIYNSALGTATTPLSTFFKALVWLVKKLDAPFIFLDGMDEDPELAKLGDHSLTRHFRDLSRHAKVFTASRPDPSIRYTIPADEGGFIRIAISDNFNQQDINTFLIYGISKLGWDERTSECVRQKLADGAKGMFLWAKLMLQHVQEQVTADDLEAALQTLPDGLPAVYAQILSKIAVLPAPRARAVARILQWAYAATRPLTIPELEAALAVKIGSPSSRHDVRYRVMNIRQLITDYCGSLLDIQERSSTVHFAHASVIQYLDSVSTKEPTLYDMDHFPLVLAKRVPHLAATCLTYLAYDDIDFVRPHKFPSEYAKILEKHLNDHPFLAYAAVELWTHFTPIDDSISTSGKELTEAIACFFKTEKNLVKWLQLYQLLGAISTKKNRGNEGFHPDSNRFATLVQSQPTLRKLGCPASHNLFSRWDRWVNEDSFNGHYCTPITIAAFFNLTDIVRKQLDKGVPVDDDLVSGITPFLYAVHGDALEAVKLLLDRGADPAAVSKAGYGAARYVSRNGLSVLPVILDIDGPWRTQSDEDEGRAIFHNIASTVGWHPLVVKGFLGISNFSALGQVDFLGRTALHRACSINMDEAIAIIQGRLAGPAKYGERGKEPRILSSSLEEAFTPNTSAGIEFWAQAWQDSFLAGSRGVELLDSPRRPPPQTRHIVPDLVRKILAYIVRELVSRQSPLDHLDHRGRTALHMTVISAADDNKTEASTEIVSGSHLSLYSEDGAQSDEASTEIESPLEVLLASGADPYIRDSSGQLAVELAIARRHWNTAWLLFEAMQSRADPLKDEHGILLQSLRLLLGETKTETSAFLKSPATPATEWMRPNSDMPNSYRDMVEAALILHSVFARCRLPQKSLNEVVRRILDLARYWGPTTMSANAIPGPPKLSISLKQCLVRKIELFLSEPARGSRQSRYPGVTSARSVGYYDSIHWRDVNSEVDLEHDYYDTILFGSDEISSGSSMFYSWDPSSQASRDKPAVFQDHREVLRWAEPMEEVEEGEGVTEVILHTEELVFPPPILGDGRLWEIQSSNYHTRIWKQTWPVEDTRAKYKELSKQTREWIGSLRQGDTITLTTAEGFSIQDISKFSKFGVVVYSVV